MPHHFQRRLYELADGMNVLLDFIRHAPHNRETTMSTETDLQALASLAQTLADEAPVVISSAVSSALGGEDGAISTAVSSALSSADAGNAPVVSSLSSALGSLSSTLSTGVSSSLAPPPAAITIPTALQNVSLNVPFAATLEAVGGVSPYSYSVSGTLPTGISMDTTGVFSGTDSADASGASFTFDVTATDSTGASGSQSFTISAA